MFQPFGSSSLAQNIIDSRLTGVTASTPMQPQDMNEFGVFRNPYSPAGFYANETDVFPKPSFTPPTTDNDGNPVCDNENGYFFDPVTQSCKLVEPEQTSDRDDRTTPEPVYQGVGSVFSPAQNAFMNLGLGGSTADEVKSYFGSGEIDPYGSGVSGFFRRFTPFGQFSTMRDVNALVNAGVLDKANDGTLTFAKGGNLALAQTNQAFENKLAKDNMMDFAQNTLGKTPEEAQAMADVTTRGDKDDKIGDPYKGLNVSSQPFKSNFGASSVKSYTPRSNFQRMSADLNRLRSKY
jgi:hypothetical protein